MKNTNTVSQFDSVLAQINATPNLTGCTVALPVTIPASAWIHLTEASRFLQVPIEALISRIVDDHCWDVDWFKAKEAVDTVLEKYASPRDVGFKSKQKPSSK